MSKVDENQMNSDKIQVWISFDNKGNLIRYTESYVAGARIATNSEREYYFTVMIRSYRTAMKANGIEFNNSMIAMVNPTDPHVTTD